MNSIKRKRNVLTIEMKLIALERIDNGEPVSRICNELNVGKSTVNEWRRNRKSLQDFCKQIESDKALSRRCTMKKPKNEIIDDALWIWFMQEQQRGTHLSGPILKEKAIQLHKKLNNGEEFLASEGWLSRWKKRHGIYLGAYNEKLPPDQNAASKFVQNFLDVIRSENLTPEQIYNLDETCFNFKLLPSKTPPIPHETFTANFKMNKERITVALCTNATGSHKLPLFVVGKSAKPRAFKNMNFNALPVYYKAQKSAWMDSFLFEEWFSSEFVPKVQAHLMHLRLPLKAILILDNTPTHPVDLTSDDIKVMFLSPGIASLIQPMDQGVMINLKKRYRRKFLSEILAKTSNEETGLIKALKNINIKDVIYMLASAFHEMPSLMFVKSWSKLWPEINELVTNDLNEDLIDCDNVDLLNNFKQLSQFKDLEERDIDQWLIGEFILENELLTDDEIIEVVIQDEMKEEQVKSEILSEDEDHKKISHSEGKKAFETAMRYIEQQHNSSPVDIIFMKKWSDFASKQDLKTEKTNENN